MHTGTSQRDPLGYRWEIFREMVSVEVRNFLQCNTSLNIKLCLPPWLIFDFRLLILVFPRISLQVQVPLDIKLFKTLSQAMVYTSIFVGTQPKTPKRGEPLISNTKRQHDKSTFSVV